MTTTLEDKLKRLSPRRREKVRRRSQQLGKRPGETVVTAQTA